MYNVQPSIASNLECLSGIFLPEYQIHSQVGPNCIQYDS